VIYLRIPVFAIVGVVVSTGVGHMQRFVGILTKVRPMKYLIPVLLTGAGIVAGVTTSIAQAHGVFNGHASFTPYLFGYGPVAILLVLAATFAVNAHRQEESIEPSRALFVLEVEGSQALSSRHADWTFLLTNCSPRTVTYVQLGPLRSEIGAYEIFFNEIPVLVPNQKVAVGYEVIPRRAGDRYAGEQATLWDFGIDHAGIRGHVFIWYDIPVHYRDADNTVWDAGVVSVCFDLERQILKTEGVRYWREQKKYNELVG
jgi:hypothetical protein